MIRVFVFVSGIAIGQFYPTAADKGPFLLLGSGQHTFASDYTMVHPHKTTIVQGTAANDIPFTGSSVVRFTAPGDRGPIKPPTNIASLNEILAKTSLELDSNCTGDLDKCVDSEGKPLARYAWNSRAPGRRRRPLTATTSTRSHPSDPRRRTSCAPRIR